MRYRVYKVLQGFQTLTSGDLKWPLTSMKNNRDHLLTKGYQRAKFEVQASFISWDIMFTKFSYFDLWWPLTSMKNNTDHLLTKTFQRTKFEVQATFTSWDIVFTSQGVTYTHTYTHTRHHHRIDSFRLWQGIKKVESSFTFVWHGQAHREGEGGVGSARASASGPGNAQRAGGESP